MREKRKTKKVTKIKRLHRLRQLSFQVIEKNDQQRVGGREKDLVCCGRFCNQTFGRGYYIEEYINIF